MTVISIIILAVLIPPVLFDIARRPTIRRLGLRNVSRRRGEAALVIGGSMLATALITASFVVGDSFGGSIRGLAEERWGPVDEIVFVNEPADRDPIVAAVQALESENIDGVMSGAFVRVALGTVPAAGEERVAEPSVRLLELDPSQARTFGGDLEATGLAGIPETLTNEQIVLNDATADDLGVVVGDQLDVFAGNQRQTFTIAAIIERTGMAGIGQAIVAPGTVTDRLLANPDLGAVNAITSLVMVSNTGDVFEGAELSDSVIDELTPAVEGVVGDTGSIEPIKQNLLEDAEQESAETTELFGTIGGFSVAAGILLVINLFVMLAGERTVELGTMRAVGMRRGAILRSFAIEGVVYGIAAAIVGALLGIAVGAGVTAYASRVLADDGFSISLFVEPASLASGAIIGLAISQLTVVLTSLRTTRLNIVRALRDLPAVKNREQTWKGLVGGVAGIALGAALWFAFNDTQAVIMIAPVIALVSSVALLGRLMPQRVALVIGCGAALAWAAAVFGVMSEKMNDPDISMFLLQGVLLVGLAVTIASALEAGWLRIARAIGGGSVATRVGMAHPLARPVRSALLVAMYSLVIFTVTFMGVMNAVFSASTPELAEQATGEWSVVLDTNETSPFTLEELMSRSDVASASAVMRRGVEIVRPNDDGELEGEFYRGDFVDAGFTAVSPPPMSERSDVFADDASAWDAAVGADATGEFVVVPDWYDEAVGDTLVIRNADGSDRNVEIVGKTANGWLVGSGMYLTASLSTELHDVITPAERYFLTPSEGTSTDQLAAAINADGVERGAETQTVLAIANDETSQQDGFLKMLQGYLGLGLLIGIAGLGVVLIRAVRERRRQIGMMRAVGLPASAVRGSFLVEAAFVGFQGVALGIGLGLLSSWQTLTQSTAFEEGLTFAIPVPFLVGLGVVSLLASLGAAFLPAMRAGKISPAAALRVTG